MMSRLRRGITCIRFPAKRRPSPPPSVWIYRPVRDTVLVEIDRMEARGYKDQVEKAAKILAEGGSVEALEVALYLGRRRKCKLRVDDELKVWLGGRKNDWLSLEFDDNPVAFTQAAILLGCQIVCRDPKKSETE